MHPKSDYARLQMSLQQEWAFVQGVTPGAGEAFGPVEEALREIFVPALFEGLREVVPKREITRLPLKQAGLALPHPIHTAPEKWTASCVITGYLVAALRGQVKFQTADHSACLQEGRTSVWRQGQIWAEEALTATLEGPLVMHARLMQRAANTGAWFTVLPSTVNGTELEVQKWRDAFFLRYGLDPPDLPKYCDGYQARFLINHALDCKKGDLVTARHNVLRDEVADLAGKAFTPSHVSNDRLI